MGLDDEMAIIAAPSWVQHNLNRKRSLAYQLFGTVVVWSRARPKRSYDPSIRLRDDADPKLTHPTGSTHGFEHLDRLTLSTPEQSRHSGSGLRKLWARVARDPMAHALPGFLCCPTRFSASIVSAWPTVPNSLDERARRRSLSCFDHLGERVPEVDAR